jgi:DNA (cytosine-5)-methyltransferase 1
MLTPQFLLPLSAELVVDNFAGGGGASSGIERAIGRPVDIAINHDPEAVAMHQRNHPQTLHLCESVWDVDPRHVCDGRPVGLAWFSPDCKHFSKAKGGKPVEKRIRGLAWVAVRWAATVAPRIICLENVEEFVTWGPLTADGRPCPRNRGREFRAFVNALQRLGYAVQWRELRACDYGAPTSRKRLFLVARRDGQPIAWPQPTHAASPARGSGLQPWRTAAECIDWSLPCPSIFERDRPLAEATLRRIARGIRRYVIEAAEPFIVRIGHTGHGDAGKVSSLREPLSTITSKAEHLLAVPTLVQCGYGERAGQAPRVPGLDKPLGTVVGASKHALVAAFLAKHYGGNETPGAPLAAPMSTITTQDHHALVAAHLLKLRGTSTGSAAAEPVPTISAQGTHIAEVRAFLVKFYGTGGQWAGLDEPMHTLPTRDRMGLVTVAGQQYQIADIGMRMLQPRELARAQGFAEDYHLEHLDNGRRLPKHAQVRMIGNSVCPPVAEALVRANYRDISLPQQAQPQEIAA